MRLVDLLLSPRQQSYGVSTNESHYRHPLGAAYLRSKNSEELRSNRKNLEFYRRQDSVLGQQAPEKPFRSTGSLSDLLRSKNSPTSPGYWNHPTVNPSSSCVTGETLRLAQLSAADSKPSVINGYVKQENDETAYFTTTTATTTTATTRGCFDICSDDRQPFLTMDKTLNGNIWNRGELSPSSATKFFPSLSSSSSSPSSASSLSSLGLEDRALNRRRVSLLSSDGSELEPEQILSLATDSDGYESLSSPLEAVDAAAGAFRWMEHAPDSSSVGYLDWHGGGGGGGAGGGGGEGDTERSGYDIDECPLFNFNFLENTLDDCPFESFDAKDTTHRYDNSSFCDSPMVSMVPDVMATETLNNCGSFSDDRDDVQSSFRDRLFRLNELDRRGARHGMKNYDGSDLSDCLPSASITALAAPVSSMENLQQSEVVKLLLQNRHQWAVPQEKVPPSPPVGCRGSRKRASATNGRDVGRAKVPREARSSNDFPSNEETSLSFASSVRTNSFSASGVGDQDRYDHSSSLEKLITELMLFESTKSDSEAGPSTVDVRRNSSETCANAFPCAELFTPSLRPSDLFDGLATWRISDTELFSSFDLESVYLSDCEPLSALGEGLDFETAKCFEAFVKTEPENAPFLSVPPSPSLAQPDSFGRPANWLSGEDGDDAANRPSSHNDNCPTIVDRHRSSVLERILQTNLLFDSLDCDPKLASSVNDHDYCQNLDILSLNSGVLDLACDQSSGLLRHEKRLRCATETAPSCYSRKRDYSALKSLLLDSNLTEEVKKEVELDRAKSRKKMSEKLKVTSVNDPMRLQRLGKIRNDRIVVEQNLENDGDLYCDFDRANSEKKERSCEEKGTFDDLNVATGYYSPPAEISRWEDFDCGTAQPELLFSAENSDSGVDNTLVTSDLELSGSGDAVFFNSFEDFYSKNQNEIDSSHQSGADNYDENYDGDPMQNGDSPTEFEPTVKGTRRKPLTSKRFRIFRSVGRSGLTGAKSSSLMRRLPPTTGKSRPFLIRTGKGRSADHRRRRPSKSTRQCPSAKSPPNPSINDNRSNL